MTSTASEIRMIPISAITVLNPRVRNKKIFNELVTSIAHLGLKKPITVSARSDQSGTTSCAAKAASKPSWRSVRPKSRRLFSKHPRKTVSS